MEQVSALTLTLIVLGIPALRHIYFAKSTAPESHSPENRDVFFDVLKGLAIIAVIIIHVEYFFLMYGPAGHEFFLNLVNNPLRFAIPFFLISTGALLQKNLDTKKDLWHFYKKRLLQIYLPYLVISFIVLAITFSSFPKAILLLFTGKHLPPYYYLIILLQCYILYPILLRLKGYRLFLPIAFIISFVSFLDSRLWHIASFPFVGQYLFFFCYGLCYRDRFRTSTYAANGVLEWITILLVAIVFWFVFPDHYYNVSLFYAVALFNLLFMLKGQILEQKWLTTVLKRFGKNSLWIYLTHFFVVAMLYKGIQYITIHYYLQFILTTVTAVPLSFAVAWWIQKAYTLIVPPAK